MSSDPHGLLVLDKPVGLTSRDAVDRALRWFPRKTRVGHTGTLDPLASGVLVLCVGHATRLTEYVQDMGKTYLADLTFGARSATDDAEGPITPVVVRRPPDRDAVDTALRAFNGPIEQVPPAFSAAKVTGRRAYDLARRGAVVELAPRTVRIDGIDVVAFEYPGLRLEVRCGKGTYVRSLARDLGERLGCGAHLAGLRRTRVGPFTPDDAVPLDATADAARARLLPPAAAVAELPRLTLSDEGVTRLRHGQSVEVPSDMSCATGGSPVSAVDARASRPWHPEDVAVFDANGGLVAIATTADDGRTLRPAKVFPA
jgi:tRNA pseudouridine55 synthase